MEERTYNTELWHSGAAVTCPYFAVPCESTDTRDNWRVIPGLTL